MKTLEQRLNEAKSKGYTPVHDKEEKYFFFVVTEKFSIGDTVKDTMNKEHKIKKIYKDGILEV